MQERSNFHIIAPTYKGLLFLLLLFLLPSVTAEGNGEVELINPSTLLMSYDSEIRELNASLMAWAEDTPIQFWETDKKITVEYEIQNNNFFALTLINSPNGNEREYPIFYCVMNEIPDYDRYSYNQIYERCEGYNYVYKLRDIREGRKVLIKIPPLETNPLTGELSNAFAWIVGDGATGGGGLPVCGGLYPQITRNETSTPYDNSFQMAGRVSPIGGVTAGCTISTMNWESYAGNYTFYSRIPLYKTADYFLSGRGTAMVQSSIKWNTFYYRYPYCEIGDTTRNIRIAVTGTYNLRKTTVYSNVLSHTCEEEIFSFGEVNITLPDNFAIIHDGKEYERESYVYAILGGMVMGLVLLFLFRISEGGKNRRNES